MDQEENDGAAASDVVNAFQQKISGNNPSPSEFNDGFDAEEDVEESVSDLMSSIGRT